MSGSFTVDLNNIPYAVFVINLEGVIVNCNYSAENLTGYSSKELLGKKKQDIILDDLTKKIPQFRKNHKQEIEGVSTSRFVQIINKSNQRINCKLKISEAENCYVAYIEKYNKNKVVLPLSNHSVQIAQNVLNGIDECFWEWDVEQETIFYSAQTMSLLGYEAKAYTGPASSWESHVSEQDLENIYLQVLKHFSKEIPCINLTCLIFTKNKKTKWVSIVGKVFEYKNGRASKMIGSIKDVSEPQELLRKLKKQNSYLQLAERLSHSGHWRIDLILNKLYWSNGIYTIHGVTPENYKPNVDSAIGFYTEKEQDKIKTYIDLAISEKKGFHFKSEILHASGKAIKVESIGEVELDSAGDVVGVFGVFRDITASEDVFEKLKLLAMVNYTIKVPIFFIDEKDNVVYQDLSPQIGNENSVLFNYINFSINDYLTFKRTAKEKGQLKHASISFDKYISVFDLSVTYESDEGIYIWIVENVTDKFRKDQQQIISNRLALLGNTFGNVSHDINNVLGVALGATEMLEIKFAQGERNISKYIERVKNAIDKGKSVTERLLAFTRKPTIKVVDFDPIQEIKDNQYLFKQLLLSTINFTFKVDNIACLIRFPQGEFINILLNLVLNAQDAIREKSIKGSIEVEAKIVSGYLEISVKDSGIGIKDENLLKVFDPFYSSKSVNKGNGIGLANVYSTIYKHNGEIRVSGDSDFGGAEFTLIFKCTVLQNNIKNKAIIKPELGIEDKTVLVLDDEESIAEFVALFLDSVGANTTYVSTKVDLEKALLSGNLFDTFITDMILPDISGREAVELVINKFPHIKIYSMSGYIAEEDSQWHYPVLRKPFNSKELADFLTNN